jgi:hypothetical protein
MAKSEYARLCASKRGREQLVNRMQALAAELGAGFECGDGYCDRRERNCTISGEGFSVFFGFRARSSVNAYLGHWNTSGGVRFPGVFGFTIRGDVNESHYGKATTCVDTIEEFEAAIRAGFERMKRELAK